MKKIFYPPLTNATVSDMRLQNNKSAWTSHIRLTQLFILFLLMCEGGVIPELLAQTESPMICVQPTGNAQLSSGQQGQGYDCPDTEIKYLRLNYHFILNDNGTGNFNETDDGQGNHANNGYKRANDVVALANYELANNQNMWRQEPGITYPTTAPANNIRYVLTGVYFHRNGDMVNLFSGNWSMHGLYAIDEETTINFYSVAISGTTTGRAKGFCPGVGDMAAKSDSYDNYTNSPAWIEFEASQINHEVGHLLNLEHTWNNDDECIDTPLGFLWDYDGAGPNSPIYGQCWGFDNPANVDPCDSWENISNNMLDYNGWFPHAYSTCQIDKIYDCLAEGGMSASVMQCGGCEPVNAFFDLPSVIHLNIPTTPNIRIRGAASFNETSYHLSIYEQANQTALVPAMYDGPVIIGEVGDINLSALYPGWECGKSYLLVLWVSNECGSTSHYEQSIYIDCKIRNVRLENNSPVSDIRTLKYEIAEQGELSIILSPISISGTAQTIKLNEYKNAGTYEDLIDTSNLQAGMYTLYVFFESELLYEYLVKI